MVGIEKVAFILMLNADFFDKIAKEAVYITSILRLQKYPDHLHQLQHDILQHCDRNALFPVCSKVIYIQRALTK